MKGLAMVREQRGTTAGETPGLAAGVAVDAHKVRGEGASMQVAQRAAPESQSWTMLKGPETKEPLGKLKPSPMWKAKSMLRPMPGKKAQSTKDCTGSVTSG